MTTTSSNHWMLWVRRWLMSPILALKVRLQNGQVNSVVEFVLEVFRLAWRESTLSYRKALKTARSDYFSSLLEQNKHNPRYLFNTVAKLTKNKASTGVDISQQHSSNDFMNYFTSKIDTIRDQIVTMQPSAILSHQIVYYRSPEEQFHSFSTIGEEELYKLVKSSKPTTCMLDPIPSKLLKRCFQKS